MKEYIKLFNNHQEYEAFIQTDKFEKPNVSHCIEEDEVHYNPKGVLPENRELWEKFNLIYGNNVTSEDLQLFSTYPITYEIHNDLNNDNTYGHWIEIDTDMEPYYDYYTPNPNYRRLSDYSQGSYNLYFEDSNDTATIDDFTSMGTTNHRWANASCGK